MENRVKVEKICHETGNTFNFEVNSAFSAKSCDRGFCLSDGQDLLIYSIKDKKLKNIGQIWEFESCSKLFFMYSKPLDTTLVYCISEDSQELDKILKINSNLRVKEYSASSMAPQLHQNRLQRVMYDDRVDYELFKSSYDTDTVIYIENKERNTIIRFIDISQSRKLDYYPINDNIQKIIYEESEVTDIEPIYQSGFLISYSIGLIWVQVNTELKSVEILSKIENKRYQKLSSLRIIENSDSDDLSVIAERKDTKNVRLRSLQIKISSLNRKLIHERTIPKQKGDRLRFELEQEMNIEN